MFRVELAFSSGSTLKQSVVTSKNKKYITHDKSGEGAKFDLLWESWRFLHRSLQTGNLHQAFAGFDDRLVNVVGIKIDNKVQRTTPSLLSFLFVLT
jgi:hypothetical protein